MTPSPTAAPPEDRRVRKSRQAIREAFIALVLDKGFDAVTVEDIAAKADIARATFYAHYPDKHELLTRLFEEITSEITEQVTRVDGAPDQPRVSIVKALYEHAEAYRNLYLVCLRGAGDGRARAAYLDVIARGASAVFAERLRATKQRPEYPLATLARVYAGAHVALLEDWLERGDKDRDRPSAAAMAECQTELLGNGLLWAMHALPAKVQGAFPKPGD
jgi:AcrR family transcriptional regulator